MNKTNKPLALDLETLDLVSGGVGPGGGGPGGGWMTGVVNSYNQARAAGQPTTRTPMVNAAPSGPPTRTPMASSPGNGWLQQAGGAIDSFLGK